MSKPSDSEARVCPVDHSKSPRPSPFKMPSSSAGQCPVKKDQQTAYNVYSQPINPENNMPSKVGPSQLPVPGQTERLPTERVSSSIPKGGTDSTWTYPSPQMFFNALNRKGKGGDVTESDAEVIVAIHNNMNERTWDQLMQWEAPHKERCPHPKLLKFRGRPDELSPLARWKALTGGPPPFDRHDWIVDRCGKEVRYIIDYYHDESKDATLGDDMPMPHAGDRRVSSISMVVRPALDSPQAVWDRLQGVLGFGPSTTEAPSAAAAAPAAAGAGAGAGAGASAPPEVRMVFPDSKLTDPEFKFLSSLTPDSVSQLHQTVFTRCAPQLKAMQEAEEDAKARVRLDYCVGSVVCPPVAEQLMAKVEAGDQQAVTEVYDDLQGRLERFSIMSNKVMAAAMHAHELQE